MKNVKIQPHVLDNVCTSKVDREAEETEEMIACLYFVDKKASRQPDTEANRRQRNKQKTAMLWEVTLENIVLLWDQSPDVVKFGISWQFGKGEETIAPLLLIFDRSFSPTAHKYRSKRPSRRTREANMACHRREGAAEAALFVCFLNMLLMFEVKLRRVKKEKRNV